MNIFNSLSKSVSRRLESLKNHEPAPPLTTKPNYFASLPEEIIDQIAIYSESIGATKLGMTSSVLNKMVGKNPIWESLCRLQEPSIKNIKDLPWKQIYIDEIDPKRFLGGDFNFAMLPGIVNYGIDVNTCLEGLRGIHLKRLIKNQMGLSCDLSRMELYLDGKAIENQRLIKPLQIDEQTLPLLIIT